MEAKIQILSEDNKLSYMKLDELVSYVSSRINYQKPTQVIISEFQENEFLKIIELCEILKITKPTVYDWIKKGVLKPIKIQSRLFFKRADVLELLEQNKKG